MCGDGVIVLPLRNDPRGSREKQIKVPVADVTTDCAPCDILRPRRLRKWRLLRSRQCMRAMFFFPFFSFILTNSCSENQSNLCPELKPPAARDEKQDPPEEARRLDRFL